MAKVKGKGLLALARFYGQIVGPRKSSHRLASQAVERAVLLIRAARDNGQEIPEVFDDVSRIVGRMPGLQAADYLDGVLEGWWGPWEDEPQTTAEAEALEVRVGIRWESLGGGREALVLE